MPKSKKIFEQIFDEYIDKIYRFIFLKVNSQEITEDLTSEVFLRFWNRLNLSDSAENSIENPRAFLYQIARNLVIDYYREKGQTQFVSLDKIGLEDVNINLEKEAILSSEMTQVQKALFGLKQDYQDVIIWHYLEELSIREIAEMLGKSENSVRLMLHRGLKELKQHLNP